MFAAVGMFLLTGVCHYCSWALTMSRCEICVVCACAPHLRGVGPARQKSPARDAAARHTTCACAHRSTLTFS